MMECVPGIDSRNERFSSNTCFRRLGISGERDKKSLKRWRYELSVWGRPLVACALEEGRLLTCLCSSTPVRKPMTYADKTPYQACMQPAVVASSFTQFFLFNQFGPQFWKLEFA